jgi:hypothetical protein
VCPCLLIVNCPVGSGGHPYQAFVEDTSPESLEFVTGQFYFVQSDELQQKSVIPVLFNHPDVLGQPRCIVQRRKMTTEFSDFRSSAWTFNDNSGRGEDDLHL